LNPKGDAANLTYLFTARFLFLFVVANYLQGKVLDQRFRWQLKKVLLTHLGSISSLKGKVQPVWGING